MGQLALLRNEALNAQLASTPPPTFTPSVADLVALEPTPEQRMNTLWEKLNPEAAARERAAALDLLARATGQPPRASPTPPSGPSLTETPFRPQEAPEQRMQLALGPTVVGGGEWKKGQGRPQAQPWVDKTLRGSGADKLASLVQDAMKASLTAAGYPQWVRMADYPWWWGPVTGLEQVEQRLVSDLAVFQDSWLPDVTKQLATENISRAMNWVREQRAAAASRHGAAPVPF
jgi:hypothetical protein